MLNCKLLLISVSAWLLLSSSWVNAQIWSQYQTTEQTRLYGTFNVNRNSAYDDQRNRYGSYNTSGYKDTIYWERNRDQLRNQYGSDGYNGGLTRDSFDSRYDSRPLSYVPSSYDSRNSGSYSRYPAPDPRSSNIYDPRNQNYPSGSFQGAASSGSFGSRSSWEQERERERERERELERERSYYLNSRTRINSNPFKYNQPYGSNVPYTKLPGSYAPCIPFIAP